MGSQPLACRVVGHRWSFRRDGPVIRWECERTACGAGGSRAYETELEAKRYFRHFARPLAPPRGLLAALGGTVDRTRVRRRG